MRLLLLALLASAVAGFTTPASSSKKAVSVARSRNIASATQLHATPPTMFIYWTIKSAADLVAYQLGVTDEFQGTGIFNGVKFEREEKENDDDDEKEN